MLLVIADKFSKWVELFLSCQATANEVIRALRERIKIFLSDNGVQFTSKSVKEFLATHGIEHRTTAFYAQNENPIERKNRVVKTLIAQQVESHHRHWDNYLPEVAFAINTAIHKSTKFTTAEFFLVET